jgi:hypothetical protein
MRCFQNRAGTGTATVAAGSELGFVAITQITHFGPVQFYMAKVPEGADINTWDVSSSGLLIVCAVTNDAMQPNGNVWFKAASISAVGSPLTSDVGTWPAYRTSPVSPSPILYITFFSLLHRKN